jgi:tetratricopeptide (TPR) repeat protein
LGEFEKSVEALNKYIALTPGEANPWDSLGYVYSKMGKVEEAIASYQEAIKIRPDFDSSNIGISYLQAFKEDYRAALDSVDHYLSLDLSPERRADAFLWKGCCLCWLGRFRDSLEAFRKSEEAGAAADWPNMRALHWARSRVYCIRGEFEAARQSAERYVDYEVEKSPQRKVGIVKIGDYLQGFSYAWEGRLDSARAKLKGMISALEEVSGWEKENLIENIFLLQAEIDLAEGSGKEALAVLENDLPASTVRKARTPFAYVPSAMIGVSLSPEFRELWARAYTEMGDLDRAIAEYERLISPDPTKTIALIHPRYYYSLGKLYEEKGMKNKAGRLYRRFLELWKDADPGIAEVDDAKSRLAALK